MRSCPTKALRVSGGKARLHLDWCIECSRCYQVCEHRAIKVMDDDFGNIFNYKYRILLVPMLFFSQFGDGIPQKTITDIIGDLGFTEVRAVEQGCDLVAEKLNEYIPDSTVRPVISTYCPSVIRLIQVRFPSLIMNLSPYIPPLEVTAQYVKRKYENAGIPSEEVGIFYVTPCVAKIASIKAPVGGYTTPVTGCINMDLLHDKVLLKYKRKDFKENGIKVSLEVSRNGMRWSTTRGEKHAMKKYINAMAIDGIGHVMEILEKTENDELDGVDFLELRACDESCSGGILVRGNRFQITADMHRKSESLPDKIPMLNEYRELCGDSMLLGKVEPRDVKRYGPDIDLAIKKMETVRKLRAELPGIDCGSCGAPSCEALAEDVVNGERTIENCIFMQLKYEKSGSLKVKNVVDIMEKIWGKKYDS
ncbi:MAG: ferredoxin [Bacteroidales bacterium]|nr:ferredoxin [Bacteroidales bacterium]MCI2121397.1 ferredoxin [Bacteroidales bacterium]MCI2145484.1 ferredoxin [Bacteroidales bacterium]